MSGALESGRTIRATLIITQAIDLCCLDELPGKVGIEREQDQHGGWKCQRAVGDAKYRRIIQHMQGIISLVKRDDDQHDRYDCRDKEDRSNLRWAFGLNRVPK